jgi:hypothetical protein
LKGHEKDHAPAPMAAVQEEIRAARNQPTQKESEPEARSGEGGLKGRRAGHFSPLWRRLSRPEWGASGKDTQQRPQHIPGIAACQPVPIRGRGRVLRRLREDISMVSPDCRCALVSRDKLCVTRLSSRDMSIITHTTSQEKSTGFFPVDFTELGLRKGLSCYLLASKDKLCVTRFRVTRFRSSRQKISCVSPDSCHPIHCNAK